MERVIPDFLELKLKEQYSEEVVKYICNGLIEEKKSTFRINRIKTNIVEVENCLKEGNIEFSKVNFFEDAFVINKEDEIKIRQMEIYKTGKIYMQSLSSMIPVLILNPKPKENILDMCAAPRWKNNIDSKFS